MTQNRTGITLRILAGAIATIGGLAVAADKAPAKAPDKAAAVPAAEGRGAAEIVRVTATVEAVDQKTRSVTLKDSKGEMVSFIAGEEVRNLAQLKKGDVVTIEYGQAVAVKLAPTTSKTRERTVTEGIKRAEPGQKPGGVAMREVRAVASVEKIDTKTNVVTLRGPEHTVDLKVRDPAMLKGVKVGDFVEASYTEALAIKVTPGK